MIDGVIFDIDGTIVDSVDLHIKAWKAAFEKYGKKISYFEMCSQIGKGGDQLMPVFLPKKNWMNSVKNWTNIGLRFLRTTTYRT